MLNFVLVDDSAQDAALAQSILGYAGHQTRCCIGASELEALMGGEVPDVVLLGVSEARINLSLLRFLKSGSVWQHVPVLVALQKDVLEWPDWVKRQGAHDLLVKPYQMNSMLAAAQQIERQRAPR